MAYKRGGDADTLDGVDSTGFLKADGTIDSTGNQKFTAGLTLTAGQVIKPTADSTTALGWANAAGSRVVTVDTSNGRLGVNCTPNATFEVRSPSCILSRANINYGSYLYFNGGTSGTSQKWKIGSGITAGQWDLGILNASDVSVMSMHQNGKVVIDNNLQIGGTANANMTKGLTINQGSADDEILALKSSDVAHGMTDLSETDTYFLIRKLSTTLGGTSVVSYTEGSWGMAIQGTVTSANTIKGSNALAPVMIYGALKSGTGVTSMSADANIFAVADGSSGAVKFLVDEEGDTWQAGNSLVPAGYQVIPDADSIAALQWANAAGSPVVTVDTSNGRLGIGGTPTQPLEVVASISSVLIKSSTITNGAFLQFNNSPGGSYFGVQGVNGNEIITNEGLAYSVAFLAASTDKAIQFATNSTARLTINSVGNVLIGGTAARATTAGAKALHIFDGTAPAGTLTNGVSFYSSSGEAYAMDAAGNATLLSPHDSDTNEWIFLSRNTVTGREYRVDMERMVAAIEELTGESFSTEIFN